MPAVILTPIKVPGRPVTWRRTPVRLPKPLTLAVAKAAAATRKD